MNYATIKPVDIANGEGVRVSLFVSGCTHHCKGCFNQVAWDFDYGQPFTSEVERDVINLCDRPYIRGLSLLGGEPLDPNNIEPLFTLCRNLKQIFPDKTIWLYTGYEWESIKHLEILQYIDVLVDGRFVQELRNLRLKFRGSSNQRIIDVQKSLESGMTILLRGNENG